MCERPSEEVRDQIRKAFNGSTPEKGYLPAELVERVGLSPHLVAMAAWDLIDLGELLITEDKTILPAHVMGGTVIL